MSGKPTILFLCTGNSCRSQMAEALLRHLGGDRFDVLSAGSHPAGFIHPLAIETMARMGIPIDEQYSKSWDEIADRPVDAVITLCDEAAKEACPTWRGSPVSAHWSTPDPVFKPGSAEERLEFAQRVAERIRLKIEGLLQTDFSAGPEAVKSRLDFLGDI